MCRQTQSARSMTSEAHGLPAAVTVDIVRTPAPRSGMLSRRSSPPTRPTAQQPVRNKHRRLLTVSNGGKGRGRQVGIRRRIERPHDSRQGVRPASAGRGYKSRTRFVSAFQAFACSPPPLARPRPPASTRPPLDNVLLVRHARGARLWRPRPDVHDQHAHVGRAVPARPPQLAGWIAALLPQRPPRRPARRCGAREPRPADRHVLHMARRHCCR
jgi:hypothetical protein